MQQLESCAVFFEFGIYRLHRLVLKPPVPQVGSGVTPKARLQKEKEQHQQPVGRRARERLVILDTQVALEPDEVDGGHFLGLK